MQKPRVKTPTILQMEAVECGAAALGIILGYYGRFVPLTELRIACGVSRDGSKAVNMLKAARQYGLDAQGAKIEFEELKEVKFPVIAFWEFNHFVVIEGFDAKKVYINDPATGPVSITHEDFDRSFTGVILIFSPTAEFKKGGEKPTLRKILAPRVPGLKKGFLYVTLVSLMLVIPGILLPGLTKIFIDNILIQQVKGWLLPLLWGIFLTGLLRLLLSYLQQYFLLRLDLKLILTTSSHFLWHVLHLPLSFFGQRLTGDVQSRVNANDRIATWLSGDLSMSVVSIISMFFFALAMFFFDPILTLIGIFTAILNAALLIIISRYVQNSSYRMSQEYGKLVGVEMAGLQGIETIKANSSENDFFQQWAGFHAKSLLSQQKLALYNNVLQYLPSLLTTLTSIALLAVGGWRIMLGYLTIGSLVAFQSLLSSFNDPLLRLINSANSLQQLRGDLMRLEDVNEHPVDPRFLISQPKNKFISETKPTKLQLINVTFGYSRLEKPILENINLSLEPGKQVALVGVSGSGKTSLINLILGLYHPWSGEILWDDQPLNQISATTLSHIVGYVDQDIFLFEGTIRQNLTMWEEPLSKQALEAAIADAELSTVLSQRAEGLDSELSFGGFNFSGGQRQQMEIARALALNPQLIILDEATSALDSAIENKIMNNIKKRNASLLIAAHRLSTIRDSDEIIVLDQGKIVERGTHLELMKRSGYYAKLIATENA
jgi:NHLM bacteriocin system ABC transporter peptidase/ATP-binding protein